MEPSSDAPHSQTTPAAQAEPAVQAEPVATPTNAEALPPKPNDKTKVSEIAADCGINRKIAMFESSSNESESRDLVLEIKAMFESSKHHLSIGGMISVPDHLRKVDEQAFTPLLLSIGPIHCSNPKLQILKKWKVRFCECLIQRAKLDLKNLVERIRVREKEIRSYYAEPVVSIISSDDFVTMILVDGMFILAYILIFYLDLSKDHPTIRIPDWMQQVLEFDFWIPNWMQPVLKSDLVLLENQLPFFVLEMLFQQVVESELEPLSELEEPLSLRKIAFEFFGEYNIPGLAFRDFNANVEHYTAFFKAFKDFNRNVEHYTKDFYANIEHFTDLVRFFYLIKSGDVLYRLPGGAKVKRYTATQLHEAGVTFKVVKEYDGCFFEMRFDLKNGVMEISSITLNDENIRLIRNIIALEQSRYVWLPFVTDFFVMLDFLIDNSKDVDLLCDKGILVNYLGDSDAAASVVNSLRTNSLDRSPKYSKICEDLNSFYNITWHKWKATLWRQYFSTPWRAASTSAAIILLLFTAIQTVCSLKSTKW